jgi:GTPase involved in cell partitioning and DNA repair
MLQGAVQGGDGPRGGNTYVAQFQMPDSVFESRVRGAFSAMDMQHSLRDRVGRRS